MENGARGFVMSEISRASAISRYHCVELGGFGIGTRWRGFVS